MIRASDCRIPQVEGGNVLRVSQAVFARLLNVSAKTVQSWEQGARQPSESARRLLQVFSVAPAAVCGAAGVPAVTLTGVSTRRRAGRQELVVRATKRGNGS